MAAECALFGVVTGCRTYLFAGANSVSGSERAVSIYSLIGTAKLNGVDPEDWLCNVLARISDHSLNHINDFLY